MNRKIRVLVVDDSPFARVVIARKLQTAGDLEVVGMAGNGEEALDRVRELGPDVITMDVEMPGVGGLSAIKLIMAERPTPIVMLSSLTSEGTDTTLLALESGAVDFYPKPGMADPVGAAQSALLLQDKIRAAARIAPERLRGPARRIRRLIDSRDKGRGWARLVVIGSSTGGPRALLELFGGLPAELSAAVVIVQHMPAGFTSSFARRLDDVSPLAVKEASQGDWIRSGQALLAPGGYHLVINSGGEVALTTTPPVNGVRPAVDVTMQSAAQTYGADVLGIVLTGMGMDGTVGASAIRARAGRIIAEHESTCVVYGMPRSVIESGNADQVVPLTNIADQLIAAAGVTSAPRGRP